MKHFSLLLLVTALGSAIPAAAQPATEPAAASETLADLSAKAREARLKGDVPTWLRLASKVLALTPDHPDILISVARANAATGNKAAALDFLAQAARRGAGIDPVRFAEFKPMAGDAAFEAVAAAAKRNLAPVSEAAVFADLADQEFEGVAYDPVTRRLFTGSEQGELLTVGMDGTVSPFVSGGGLRQILGIKVDAKRRLLWLANGRYPEPNPGPDAPKDMGTGGIRAYHLDTGKLVTAAELDERPTLLHGFNDVALAADGTVYVTDTNSRAVYKLTPGGKQLELVLRDGAMSFPNGIVVSPDGRTVYVAHTEGISAIDPATGQRRRLAVPADGTVTSIDGLLLHDNIFYGVQNSPYMNRIAAAALAPDGRSIAKVWAISAHTPAGYSQTTATIDGEYLYMVGGAPVPDVYGGTNDAKPMRKVWRVPLKLNGVPR